MEKSIKQVGNYRLRLRRNKRGGFMCLESVNGDWGVQWREDSAMYGLLLTLCDMDDKVVDAYLERLLASYFVHTTHMHDWLCMVHGGVERDGEREWLPFLDGYWKLVHEAVEREVGYEQETARETRTAQNTGEGFADADEAALDEVMDMMAVQEGLEEMTAMTSPRTEQGGNDGSEGSNGKDVNDGKEVGDGD